MIYKHIGIIFGGTSGEHEVSLVSAQSVMNALSRDRYNIIPIGISKSGRWVCGEGAMEALKSGKGIESLPQCIISPDPQKRVLLVIHPDGTIKEQPLDVVFPVLHGPYGEDGTIQGLFEIADIPYVGCGVLSSAICMNKIYQKRVFNEAGIPQVDFHSFFSSAFRKDPAKIIDTIQMVLDYPVFVKPASLGSSVGISKARNVRELTPAIEEAARYDAMILVEEAVPEPRELEVAVLGNENPIVSIPGEVVPSNEFYDYKAKYVDGASELIIPADIPDMLKERIQDLALRSYSATLCEGLARIDFLYSSKTGELVVNEINTMPGFTAISMYPKLFDHIGIPYPELLDRLIKLAIARHARRQDLSRSFDSDSKWYE